MRMLKHQFFALALLGLMIAASPADEPKPDNPPAESKTPAAEELFTQGRNALFQGQYDKAADLLSKAVEADKTKTSYRLHLARAYRYAGKDDAAVTQLEEILKSTPDHVEAGQTLGEIYSAKKQWKDVARVMEPILEISPRLSHLSHAGRGPIQPGRSRQGAKKLRGGRETQSPKRRR